MFAAALTSRSVAPSTNRFNIHQRIGTKCLLRPQPDAAWLHPPIHLIFIKGLELNVCCGLNRTQCGLIHPLILLLLWIKLLELNACCGLIGTQHGLGLLILLLLINVLKLKSLRPFLDAAWYFFHRTYSFYPRSVEDVWTYRYEPQPTDYSLFPSGLELYACFTACLCFPDLILLLSQEQWLSLCLTIYRKLGPIYFVLSSDFQKQIF